MRRGWSIGWVLQASGWDNGGVDWQFDCLTLGFDRVNIKRGVGFMGLGSIGLGIYLGCVCLFSSLKTIRTIHVICRKSKGWKCNFAKVITRVISASLQLHKTFLSLFSKFELSGAKTAKFQSRGTIFAIF